MRKALRFLAIVSIAGAGLAAGVGILAPEVRAVATAGRAGEQEDLFELAELSERSLVFDRKGTLMAVLHAEENRSPISLTQVPAHVVNAILDVEDDRFWEHNGVDVRSTARALVTNVQSGEVRQGGSTITQQLVKNALLTPEKSLDRKVREAVLAVRLEDKLTKQEILERYLNTVYFGNGAYGVQAAAESYFGRTVERLTIPQAALLAGIIRNPVGYDPIKFPERAKARRDLALDRMVANGHVTTAELPAMRAETVPTKVIVPTPPPNDYFTEEVKQRLLDDTRLGETPQERYNSVFKGGLKIHTTFDPAMQAAAQDAVKKNLPNTNGRFAAAVASVEPGTGAVRAIVGGDDFSIEKYNLATQGKRQPGSSYKPFVLLAAFENGIGPNDSIDGTSPCTLKVPGFAPYTPGNYEGSAGSIMPLTAAMRSSVNCAFVRLGADVGLDKVVDTVAKLGIPKSRLQAIPSMSLGTLEATPLEMAAAYATIANDGMYVPPRFIEKVEDRRGKVLFEGPLKGTRAVSVQSARMAVQVMEGVVSGGTGTRARLAGREVAGKTGTSQNYENAWFVGFTPQLSTAVWMGAPEGNIPMTNVRPIGRVTGGSFPAMIWRAYMSRALEGLPAMSFPAPNPRQIPKAKFIKDKYSTEKRVPGTSTTSSTMPGPPPPPGEPAPTSSTTAAPTTTVLPTTTPTTAKPTSTTAKPPPSSTSTTGPGEP